VPPDKYNDMVRQAFGTPNPGSAKEKTMLRALESGKLDGGEAGLRQVRSELQRILNTKVDISVIRQGSSFDRGPFIPVQ
jgi:hypothetical protein